MNQLYAWLNSQRALGLLVVRVIVGGILFWSGYLKVFGAGFAAVINQFDRMGIFIPQITGPFIAVLELGGGAAVVLGVLTRLFGILFTIEFIVAYIAIKAPLGYANFRIDLALIAFGVLLATHGAGAISIDWLFKRER